MGDLPDLATNELGVRRDDLLAQRLVDLAMTGFDGATSDLRLRALVERLVEFAVELTGVEAAGVLLADTDRRLEHAHSSTDLIAEFELLQVLAGDGPCFQAWISGEPVMFDALRGGDALWPKLGGQVADAGFGYVYSVPMRARQDVIGALNLFGPPDGMLEQSARETAQHLAAMATVSIVQVRSVDESTRLASQLQAALRSRVVIEQAKGVLSAAGRVDMETAFQALRRYARSSNLRLKDVARSVTDGDRHPAEVLDVLRKRPSGDSERGRPRS